MTSVGTSTFGPLRLTPDGKQQNEPGPSIASATIARFTGRVLMHAR